jgi:ATP-binding cassette subfamily B protein
MLRHLRNSAEHIAELLRATPQRGGSRTLPAGPLGVRFESVRKDFDGREVLKEISFEAAPGSTTALVGPSGVGKTTVANLLSRFMDADSGRILVGDIDVRELPPEHLHAHISLVLQDPHLFHDTALNNIRFGRPGASLEEARAAGRAACCDEFISRLPQGYDTVLGESGASLSGGERKRVAVARAILKNAPIVVLDEATASLDPENEAQMQAAFRTLLADKTVLLIAHRLSTVRGADQILFIQDGRIAERGGFEELLALGGRFRRFWDLQRSARGWRITPA